MGDDWKEKILNMMDSELIDEYVQWNEAFENISLNGWDFIQWDFIKAEIKRRGITDEQIEIRKKELYKIWGRKKD